MVITLFKGAVTGKTFRPADFNGNMSVIETAINDLQEAGADDALVGRIEDLESVVGGSGSGLVHDLNDLETVVGGTGTGLVGDVSELRDDVDGMLSNSDMILSDDNSNATGGSIQMHEFSGMVFANIIFEASGGFDDLTDEVVSLRLASAFRPGSDIHFPAIFCTDPNDGATAIPGIVKVSASGYVSVSPISAGKTLMFATAFWEKA
jgi:hypothetical protein